MVSNNHSLAVHDHIYNVCSTMVILHIAFGITQGHREVIVSNNCVVINLDIEISLYDSTDREGLKETCER